MTTYQRVRKIYLALYERHENLSIKMTIEEIQRLEWEIAILEECLDKLLKLDED